MSLWKRLQVMSYKKLWSLSFLKQKQITIHADYKSTRIAGAFDEECIKYKNEGDDKLSIEYHLQKLRPHLHDSSISAIR